MRREFADFDSGQLKWSLPLLLVRPFMTLSGASTMQEGFECARECVTALYFKRKRCSRTYTKALCCLPLGFSRAREAADTAELGGI